MRGTAILMTTGIVIIMGTVMGMATGITIIITMAVTSILATAPQAPKCRG